MAFHLIFLLILTGVTGIQNITTVSEVSAKVGDSITIPCLYGSQYINHVKYLCKGSTWLSCSTKVQTKTPGSLRKFSISDDKKQRIFTVTIKDLTDKETDYYWCAVEIDGGPDVKEYFHLSVTRDTPDLYVHHQEITGFNGEEISINCQYSNSGELKWCRLGGSCVTRLSESIDGTRMTINVSVHVFTVTMSGLRTESSGWYWCANRDLQMPVHVTVTEKPTTSTPEPVNLTTVFANKVPTPDQGKLHSASADLKLLIIPLSLLVFIVMVTLFTWFRLKKHKQNKAASSAMTTAEADITYSNIDQMRKTASQRSYTESDVDVMYSSVTMRPQSVRKFEANDENVTYSTLAYSTSTF